MDPLIKQWGSARTADPETLDNRALDKLLVWRMNDPRYADRTRWVRSLPMQQQYTIEFRVDFADRERFTAVRLALLALAKHGLTECQLIQQGDAAGQKPTVACYSNDFFADCDEIDAMEDVIKQANDKFGHLAKADDSKTGVSDDLAEALRELRDDANGGA